MTLVCEQCGVHVVLPRREPVCPYCARVTTWIELQTLWDTRFLHGEKITPNIDPREPGPLMTAALRMQKIERPKA